MSMGERRSMQSKKKANHYKIIPLWIVWDGDNSYAMLPPRTTYKF